jgi:uncharacterized phage protein gp47/JayE
MSDVVNSPDYGVLSTGFSRMRLPEIRQAIIDSLQSKTQLTFETRPDSITGQFIDVFAERETVVWELAQAVYHAMYPISAFGVNLDHAVSFAGVTRLFALQSLAWVNFYGVQNSVIPTGTIVRSETSRENFLLQTDLIIDANNTGDITVSVDTAVTGNTYSISLVKSGEPTVIASYVAILGDTNVIIANHLSPLLVSANYSIVQDAHTIRIYRVDGIGFQVNRSVGISVLEFGTTGLVMAENYGELEIPIDSITQIVTTRDGLKRVNNVTPGQSGRQTETDDQLRMRYVNGVYRLGAATLNAIRANLEQNILGLMSVSVYENKNDFVDSDGREPHCIEVVAYGGDPQAIGNEIFRVKAAGIATFGSITVDVTDSAGYTHAISFNRPVPVYVWVMVSVNKYNEETFPANGDTFIAEIIAKTGNEFGVGKDIITQRFYGPIYSQVSGIGSVIIMTAVTISPDTVPAPGEYTLGNKNIAVRELSRFATDRISVAVS